MTSAPPSALTCPRTAAQATTAAASDMSGVYPNADAAKEKTAETSAANAAEGASKAVNPNNDL
jgi:hypothetical protein